MKRINNVLKTPTSEGLQALVDKSQDMEKLSHKLRETLGPALGSALVGANVRDGNELVVISSSPAWAARLRYEADTLLRTARAAGNEVTVCRVRVVEPR